jgi:SpoVK/Ycf46/Vps4 family AAA+-type ATPase
VSFDKKIIVFEDIDCIGDVVLDRKNKDPIAATVDKGATSETTKLCEIMQTICETNELNTVKMPTLRLEEPITLDDILNLWDGIRETPGRILVISSNHYKKLDPALTRPGRIDITHELSNVSHKTIAEMYHHLFGNKLSTSKLKKIEEFLYSPAELINFYVQYKNENDFVKRLTENRKIM